MQPDLIVPLHRQLTLLSCAPFTSLVRPANYCEISIALAAPSVPTARGFLPWRLSDTGPGARGRRRDGPASGTLQKC
jgi:hypothetical protein